MGAVTCSAQVARCSRGTFPLAREAQVLLGMGGTRMGSVEPGAVLKHSQPEVSELRGPYGSRAEAGGTCGQRSGCLRCRGWGSWMGVDK